LNIIEDVRRREIQALRKNALRFAVAPNVLPTLTLIAIGAPNR
jgi:hypothetical protein